MTITTKKAMDILPYMGDIMEKTEVEKLVQDEKKSVFSIITFMLKNSKKIEDEIYNIVAIAQEITVEEVKKQKLIKTLKTMKDIFDDKELYDFFRSAMK